MYHVDTIIVYPIFLYIYNYNKNYARLLFYNVICILSINEVLTKEMYFFQYNDLNEYNYIGEKCQLILLQYFITDIFYIDSITLIIHHILVLIGLCWCIYFSIGYYITIYLCLNEISSIFLLFKEENILPRLNNLLFNYTFFIFRIMLIPEIMIMYYYNNTVFILLSLDYGIHIYWIMSFLLTNN